MGSLCKYLIDRYGIGLFKEIYGGRTVEDVYGRSYDTLVGEWQEFLGTTSVPNAWRGHVEFYFKRPSIFAKDCARRVASLNEAAYRTLEKNNSIEAMKVFSEALRTSWNTESYQGLVRAAFNAARYDTVVALVGEQVRDSSSRSGILNLFLLYGDALWRREEIRAAKRAYQEVLDLDLSDRMDEYAAMRLAGLEDGELQHALPQFFAGTMKDSIAIITLENLQRRMASPLLAYLKAKFFLRMNRYSDAFSTLDTVQSLFPFPMLNAGREQILGQALFRLKEFGKARIHFWQSLNYVSNQASQDRVNDWIERCEWFETHARFRHTETPKP